MHRQHVQQRMVRAAVPRVSPALQPGGGAAAALVQRAMDDPSVLMPHEINVLQCLVGNQTMQRLLAQRPAPSASIQRSWWDEVGESVGSAVDWLTGDETEPTDWNADEPMRDPDIAHDEMEQANEPAFENAIDPTPEAPPTSTTEESSWFDSWSSPDEGTQAGFHSSDGEMSSEPSADMLGSGCNDIAHEVQRLDELVRYLYEISESMFPEVSAAKHEYEALEATRPGSAEAAEAKYRYEELLRRYNDVVDRCVEAIRQRDALREQLKSCRAGEKQKPGKGKSPQDYPCC